MPLSIHAASNIEVGGRNLARCAENICISVYRVTGRCVKSCTARKILPKSPSNCRALATVDSTGFSHHYNFGASLVEHTFVWCTRNFAAQHRLQPPNVTKYVCQLLWKLRRHKTNGHELPTKQILSLFYFIVGLQQLYIIISCYFSILLYSPDTEWRSARHRKRKSKPLCQNVTAVASAASNVFRHSPFASSFMCKCQYIKALNPTEVYAKCMANSQRYSLARPIR